MDQWSSQCTGNIYIVTLQCDYYFQPGSPNILLSGPSEVKMTLTKVDPHLTSFEMEVAKMTSKVCTGNSIIIGFHSF